MDLAVRITLGMDAVRLIVNRWAPHIELAIGFQHSENANRIHCHLLLIGCRVSTQRLKQLAQREERGNAFWSFKKADGDLDRYITYMGKGNMDNHIIHYLGHHGPRGHENARYTEERITQLVGQWSKPAPAVRPALAKYLEFECIVKGLPEEMREMRRDIRAHATNYVFKQWGMFNQQANNEIANYTATYCYKNKIRV